MEGHEDVIGYYEISNIRSDAIALKDHLILIHLSLTELNVEVSAVMETCWEKVKTIAIQPKAHVTHCRKSLLKLVSQRNCLFISRITM